MSELSLDLLSTPEALAQTLQGKRDDEVDAVLVQLGVQAALDKVFLVMQERTLAQRMGQARAVVRWQLRTPEGSRTTQLEFEQGRCNLAADPSARRPDVTLETSTPTFLRIVSGMLSALDAYARGTLRVDGDLTLAMQHQGWFDIDLSKAELSIAKPSELKRLVDGRNDGELEAGIVLAGIDRALDQVFDGMVHHFLPHKGPRKRTVVEWDVRTPSGPRVYQLAVDRSGASFRRGAGEPAGIKLGLALPDLLRVAAGTLDPIRALAAGRLKLRGNPLAAYSIPSWFDLTR